MCCVNLCHICDTCRGQRNAYSPLELQLQVVQCEYWKLNFGPLEDQKGLLTTKHSSSLIQFLSTLVFLLLWSSFKHFMFKNSPLFFYKILKHFNFLRVSFTVFWYFSLFQLLPLHPHFPDKPDFEFSLYFSPQSPVYVAGLLLEVGLALEFDWPI